MKGGNHEKFRLHDGIWIYSAGPQPLQLALGAGFNLLKTWHAHTRAREQASKQNKKDSHSGTRTIMFEDAPNPKPQTLNPKPESLNETPGRDRRAASKWDGGKNILKILITVHDHSCLRFFLLLLVQIIHILFTITVYYMRFRIRYLLCTMPITMLYSSYFCCDSYFSYCYSRCSCCSCPVPQ